MNANQTVATTHNVGQFIWNAEWLEKSRGFAKVIVVGKMDWEPIHTGYLLLEDECAIFVGLNGAVEVNIDEILIID